MTIVNKNRQDAGRKSREDGLKFENTTTGGSNCEIRQYGNAWSNSKSDLAFFTGDTADSSTERMRLKADGRTL